MDWNFLFFFNSIFLGFGLALDAFSVSVANGIKESDMPRRKGFFIAAIFAAFQALMPLIGWFCVRTIATYFKAFEAAIPWIALILLCFIGGKMLVEGIQKGKCGCKDEESGDCACRTGIFLLLLQGIATSIDALSVGFTIAQYHWQMALVAALLIAVVTFLLCSFGVAIGKKFGNIVGNKADVLGGCILIVIGIEIFLTGLLG